MDSEEKPVHLTRGRFDEFDQLAEAVAGWDLVWRQLDAGSLKAELSQIETESTLIAEVRFSRRFFQSGATPPGMLTFAVVDQATLPERWCGKPVKKDELLCFSDEYESVSDPGFRANTLSFSEENLASAAERLGLGDRWRRVVRPGSAVGCDPSRFRALQRRVREVFHAADVVSAPARTRQLTEAVEGDLAVMLLGVLASAEGHSSKSPGPSGNRGVVARRARTYIEEHCDAPPRIDEVCGHLGVSLRTLQYAFREHVGVTPRQYLRLVRLDHVRTGLLSGRTTKVADIANRWGFWHMGQFAADYRQRYGELPSETIGRRPPKATVEGDAAAASRTDRAPRRRVSRRRAPYPRGR